MKATWTAAALARFDELVAGMKLTDQRIISRWCEISVAYSDQVVTEAIVTENVAEFGEAIKEQAEPYQPTRV